MQNDTPETPLSYEDKLQIEAEMGNLKPEEIATIRKYDAIFAKRGVHRNFLEPYDVFMRRVGGQMVYSPRAEDL